MNLRILLLTTATAAALALPATLRAEVKVVDRHSQVLPLTPEGTLRLDNARGDIMVTGADVSAVTMVVDRAVIAADQDALLEARRSSKVNIRTDGKNMILQSLTAFHNESRWNVAMHYQLRVPRGVAVQINSGVSDRVVVSSLTGALMVKNNGGDIAVSRSSGPMNIESGNGDVRVIFTEKPRHNARIGSVNGSVEVTLPRESAAEWVAESLRGNFFSTLDMRGGFDAARSGKFFRAVVNGGNGPRLETFTVTGPIFLLASGTTRQQAGGLQPNQVVERPASGDPRLINSIALQLLRPMTARSFVFQRSQLEGDVSFDTSIGNIIVGEVRGRAQLRTRGGEIVLGRGGASAEMRTMGGPINVGYVVGPIQASTEAGDVTIRSVERGGTVETGGGDVLVGFAGDDVSLESGGGDLTVRRAGGSVDANTRSGNVLISMDPAAKSEHVVGKTIDGNVTLNIPSDFAADVDATIFTSDPSAHKITSDLPGLTVVTDRAAGGKTRIRATGKINGGGQRVELRTEEGDIFIRAMSPAGR